ncbi:flagellar biosynthetic protein FliR [Sedimenticola hydrogenitrophicus]|jgi:flagellar biosynthetic protein FliR|uniref:flagellar biosynthetic protein FliR n=1 Tax=Sedimenticola hydrogenitrophicus TaxID=2967975 RepID=UPI0023AEF23B|nr:flagellar biosynthetic protein FliR [Sedimenticola hydrogenitrophicus]
MLFSDVQLQTWLAAFFWPFVRIGALMISAPVFSSRQTPVLFRIGFTLVLTWVLVPVIPPPPVVDAFSHEAFVILLQQILIGVFMGFILQMVFAALIFGGQVIAYSMGLGFASMVDPQNGVQVPVISQFYLILATLLFLILNGHLVLIETLAQSFHTFPVAMTGLSQNGLSEIVGWASRMFTAGLLMALPVVAALLLVNLGMGVIGRAAPQLNIFAVGFPMSILIGFMLIWITLPDVMGNFSQLLDEGLSFTQQLLRIER